MNNYYYQKEGDRFIAFPFLLGALTGGVAVGLTRPRPVYAVSPYQQQYPQPYPQPYPYPYPQYQTYNYYRRY